MKILVVGGGGREHAIAWRLARSGATVVCSPGNPGMAAVGKCVPAPSSIEGYADLARSEGVDLTVVGPEVPLVAGIVDVFASQGLRIVGPTKAAAQLEGSKIFAKRFFERAGIPTARSVQTESVEDALAALAQFSLPVVIKADGLEAGKGVIIAHTRTEAEEATKKLGSKLVIEEFLEGEEISFIGISNGTNVVPLAASQDHKRIFDGDEGPNTGGMGAYTDSKLIDAAQTAQILRNIMYPAIQQMAREGTPFQGFLYAGLMMTADGPKVLEFNVRLGDPETQALLHRLRSGFLEALEFAANGDAAEPIPQLSWSAEPSLCIVLAAEGYPASPVLGDKIEGLGAKFGEKVQVFHAGTKRAGEDIVTSGGRVLGVVASGTTLQEARDAAYEATGRIHFRGQQFRKDIGAKGLQRYT